jgi:hypothetical protein
MASARCKVLKIRAVTKSNYVCRRRAGLSKSGRCIIKDGNGRALSCVYFKDEHGRRSAAALFTRDEARHLAAAVAKLPDLFASGTRSDCCDRPTERKRLEVNRRSIPQIGRVFPNT